MDECLNDVVLGLSAEESSMIPLNTMKRKREISDTSFEIGKPCQHFDWMLQSSSGWKVGKVSNLKVGIREPSFLFMFMQESTEKQPLW